MACSKFIKKSETFTEMLPGLGDMCTELWKYHDFGKGCPNSLVEELLHNSSQSNYTLVSADSRIIEFRCLNFFRLKSGDLTLQCLPNGTWSGEKPVCVKQALERKSRKEVEKRQKWRKLMEMGAPQRVSGTYFSSESTFTGRQRINIMGSSVDSRKYPMGTDQYSRATADPELSTKPSTGTIPLSAPKSTDQSSRPSVGSSSVSSKSGTVRQTKSSPDFDGPNRNVPSKPAGEEIVVDMPAPTIIVSPAPGPNTTPPSQ